MILTNQNKVAFNIIDKAVTKELPDGDAGLAWRKLSAKYDSKSSVKVVELSHEFNESRLTSLKTDPEDWIVELKILQARLDDMNFPITEKHLLTHVMHNRPEQYDSVVEADEKLISDASNPLTIETLTDHLHSKWERIVRRKGLNINDDDDEAVGQALIAGSQFKGRCTFCGKIGHKANV